MPSMGTAALPSPRASRRSPRWSASSSHSRDSPRRQNQHAPHAVIHVQTTRSPGATAADLGADLLDDAGALVAQDDRRLDRRVALPEEQVGVAQPAGADAHQRLARAQRRRRDLLDAQRRVELGHDGGAHRATYIVRPCPTSPSSPSAATASLLITLNRPEARNAVNLALAEGVAAALDELDADDDLAVGVITGAGAGFCAGMDLKAFVTGERPWVGDRGFAGIVQRAVAQAAHRGDRGLRGRRRARDRARLRPDRRRARGASSASPRSSARWSPPAARSPPAPAPALRRRDGAGAHRRHRSRPSAATSSGSSTAWPSRGGAVDAALELAGAIAANGPLALDATKAILQQQFDWSEEEFWQRQGELSGPVFTSEDAREGAVAFSEKRDPVWQGR